MNMNTKQIMNRALEGWGGVRTEPPITRIPFVNL